MDSGEGKERRAGKGRAEGMERRAGGAWGECAYDLVDMGCAGSELGLTPAALGIGVWREAVSEEEAEALVEAARPHLRRRRFEAGHWDGVIRQYREVQLERDTFSGVAADMLSRIQSMLLRHAPDGAAWHPVHVLELAAEGEILPHVDSVKFGGKVLCGLSLVSPAVMRLTRDRVGGEAGEEPVGGDADPCHIDVLLPPRSLYLYTGAARYEWAHAILPGTQLFKGVQVHRSRRISVMLRDMPPEEPLQ